jgi:hypothetical protein
MCVCMCMCVYVYVCVCSHQGVPRLTELINVATTLKTPAMVIRASADRSNDSEMCVPL